MHEGDAMSTCDVWMPSEWHPTVALRFVKRCLPRDEQAGFTVRILQQQWVSGRGEKEWRDVPEATEDQQGRDSLEQEHP